MLSHAEFAASDFTHFCHVGGISFYCPCPIPGVDPVALKSIFQSNALLGMLDMFSGGALKNFSVAAMGVYPYITSTIIIQLLQPVIPALQRLSMEGEAGRDKVNRISHLLTIPLAGYPVTVRLCCSIIRVCKPFTLVSPYRH